MDPVVIHNQGAETIWHPRRLEGFTLTCDKCAGQCESGKPCPSATPRYPIRFSPKEKRAEVAGTVIGVTIVVLIAFGVLALHFVLRSA